MLKTRGGGLLKCRKNTDNTIVFIKWLTNAINSNSVLIMSLDQQQLFLNCVSYSLNVIQYIIIINTWIIFLKTLTSKASKKNLKHFGNKNFECKLFYIEMSFWLYMSSEMPAVHASFWSVTSLKLQWVLIAKGTKWNKKIQRKTGFNSTTKIRNWFAP